MPLQGGSDLRNVALRLEATGQVGLKRAMYRNLRAATAAAPERVRQSALDTLPKTGHLNEWVADAVIKTTISRGVRSAGVSLRMRKTGHDLPAINAGLVRHPVYGQRKVWAYTRVTPGFFTKPLEGMRPEVTAACIAAMRQAAIEAGFR